MGEERAMRLLRTAKDTVRERERERREKRSEDRRKVPGTRARSTAG